MLTVGRGFSCGPPSLTREEDRACAEYALGFTCALLLREAPSFLDLIKRTLLVRYARDPFSSSVHGPEPSTRLLKFRRHVRKEAHFLFGSGENFHKLTVASRRFE